MIFFELISNKYILHWLNSPFGVQVAKENTYKKKASKGNLNMKNVKKYLAQGPPKYEQFKIIKRIKIIEDILK